MEKEKIEKDEVIVGKHKRNQSLMNNDNAHHVVENEHLAQEMIENNID